VKISIAMASFNGARFIREQLESFSRQTRPPDEVVICDDGSTDCTAGIVAEFSAGAPFPVHFHRNAERLGYVRNFERAISLATGDVIFLSDQDDVWFEDKVQSICRHFEANPHILVIVNDQLMTDGRLNESGATKLGNLSAIGLTADGMCEGCCTAFRAEWAHVALPVPEHMAARLISHDCWLNELAIFLKVRLVERRTLQYFRRHGANATNWIVSEPRRIGIGDLIATRSRRVPTAGWRARIEILNGYERWVSGNRRRLATLPGADVEGALQRIEHERLSHQARIELTAWPLRMRLPAIARLLGRGGYGYFFGWKSAIRDVVRSRR
jgi:glycosyltransferase involved in cell wall biosynthesis